MPKAAISSKAFLIEGGCNACGLQNTETFTIHFEDQRSAVLDHFDVPSLVQVIAQKNGLARKGYSCRDWRRRDRFTKSK